MPDQRHEWSKAQRYAVALVLSAMFWLLAWYGDTGRSLVAIWQRSETFAHGYLIVPISAWLIWRQRHDLAALELRPNFLVLPLLALAGFGWLLGELAGVGVVQQYCLVIMIPLLVWTVLGNEVVRALAFPLLFLLFAVPFGEFLVPPLMQYTAEFTVFALRLTGIPVYREGLLFTLPSGSWSVVEACSGLRYLIASLTLGFLYAYLTYRTFVRRAIFVVAAVIVPIIANWLRAYMIVMIGHLSSMQYAVGIDHLIYGWVFFGIVMLILFWVGSFWREDLDPQLTVPASMANVQRNPPALAAVMVATIAAAVMATIWPVTASRLEGTGPYPPPVVEAPSAAGGWQPITERLTDWIPHFANPDSQINRAYAKNAMRAELYIGYYRNQRQGAELITSQNTLVTSNNSALRNVGEIHRTLIFTNEKVPLIEAQLRGQSTDLLVWYWYWIGGEYTVNPYWAKLLQAKSELFGRGDAAAVIVMYTDRDVDGKAAAVGLQDFATTMLPGIARSLRDAR